MYECIECKKITDKLKKKLCIKCYGRQYREHKKRQEKVYDIPPIGEINYSEEGKPICHICGKAYNKLLTHVYYTHKMREKEYKKEFGLNLHQGIASNKTKVKLQKSVELNYEKVVAENLICKGKETRFKKGSEGRTKEKLSIQEYKNLVKRGKMNNYKNLRHSKNKSSLK